MAKLCRIGFVAVWGVLIAGSCRRPSVQPPGRPSPSLAPIRIELRTPDGNYQPLQGAIFARNRIAVRFTSLPRDAELLQVILELSIEPQNRGQEASLEEVDITGLFAGEPASGATTTKDAAIEVRAGAVHLIVTFRSAGAQYQARAGALALNAPDESFQTALRREEVFRPDLGVSYEAETLLLAFQLGTSLEDISRMLSQMNLDPKDWIAPLGLVRARIADDIDPVDLTNRLLKQIRPPLISVSPNLVLKDEDSLGERMPSRLTDSYNGNCRGRPPARQGCFERGSSVQVELRLFRYHFFYDTFAGHRLVEHLAGNGANMVGIAIVDGGFGDGTNTTNIPDNAFFNFSSSDFFRTATFQQAGGRVTVQVTRINNTTGVQECRNAPNAAWVACAFSFPDVEDETDHGTAVAVAAAGRAETRAGIPSERTALGVSPRAQLRILRTGRFEFDRVIGVFAAALDQRVQVINVSSGGLDPNSGAQFTGGAGVAVNALATVQAQQKILVTSAGNDGVCTDPTAAGQSPCGNNRRGHFPSDLAPGPGPRPANSALVMAVSASATRFDNTGPERLRPQSNYGPRISVAAGGDEVILPRNNSGLSTRNGTSFAAPAVAGLAAEMLFLDRNLPAPQLGPRRIVEIIEATADDLGATATRPTFENDQPANGLDIAYGHGRINVWKALLAVANRGLASNPGNAFPSLRAAVLNDNTWYGFVVQSPIYGATLWLNGTQIRDAQAVQPDPGGGALTRDLSAYKGVESLRVIQRGVPDEDPTSGIVPVGVGAGEYLATFSIQQRDLTNCANQPCTLSLRKPGDGRDAAPFFSVAVGAAQLALMRGGNVPGVVFDDFVFEVTPTEFGDAPQPYPTRLVADNGARSLNANLEWFGTHPDSGRAAMADWIDGVGPEQNSETEANGPDAGIDPDGVVNVAGRPDLDRFDHGILFFPRTYTPGNKDGQVEFTLCVADASSERYAGQANPDRLLWVNGWIDWNTDGKWEENQTGEHIVDGVGISPRGWRVAIRSGRTTRARVDGNCATFRQLFQVPAGAGTGNLWARFRVDYGENAGRNDPRPDAGATRRDWRSDPSLRDANLSPSTPQQPGGQVGFTRGASRFGEVEDYLIGTDYGDARDPNYPSRHASQGAYALNFTREWLGKDGANAAATREVDACDQTQAEQDRVPNLGADCKGEDRDGEDMGVVLPNTVAPGQNITVSITVTSHVDARGFSNVSPDGAQRSQGVQTLKPNCMLGAIAGKPETPAIHRDRGRYAAWDERRRLRLNVWADWNADGDWDDAGEQVVANQPVDPEDFGQDGRYTLGEPFDDRNADGVFNGADVFTAAIHDVGGAASRTFACQVTVPRDVALDKTYYWRARLAYGEGVAGNAQVVRNSVLVEGQNTGLNNSRGGSWWGEVEDYPQKAACIEEDRFEDSRVSLTLRGPRGEEVVLLEGPMEMHFQVCDPKDGDGDGLESIPLRSMILDLAGKSKLYGNMRLRMTGFSDGPVGEIEEMKNATKGVLDLAPFASAGRGMLRVKLPLSVEMGGGSFRPLEPVDIETPITFKPPRREIMDWQGSAGLVDAQGREAGFTIVRLRITPRAGE